MVVEANISIMFKLWLYQPKIDFFSWVLAIIFCIFKSNSVGDPYLLNSVVGPYYCFQLLPEKKKRKKEETALTSYKLFSSRYHLQM